ncbi:MAG: cohesin domain-containing protein, partial [bacterium]
MKKKFLYLLLFSLAGMRLGFAQIEVSLPKDASAEQGKTAIIPVTINPADGISSVMMDFSYDPSVLSAAVVTAGVVGFNITSDLTTAGVVKFTMTALIGASLTGKQEFAKVTFSVIGAPGSVSALTVGNVDLMPKPAQGIQKVDGKFTVASPDIIVDSLDLDFNNEEGEIEVDTQVLRTVKISNDGGSPLEVREIKLIGNTANEFRIESGAENLPRQLFPFSDTLQINLSCHPTTPGSKEDTLQIFSNDPDENPVNVKLTAIAVPKPIIEISRQLIRIPLDKDTVHVHLKNNGGGRLKWRARPSQDWISLDPEKGSLRKDGGTDRVIIRVDRNGLCERDSAQSITITGDSHIDPETIALKIAIYNPPP